jgi:hypothetical protein
VQTCKHLQVNPFVYLRDVIERVSTHPAGLVLELTTPPVEAPAARLPRANRRLIGASERAIGVSCPSIAVRPRRVRLQLV